MKGFILGLKGDQSQIFNSQSARVPVTYIKTSPCYLVDIKVINDQCLNFKLGFETIKNIKKPVEGELKKAGIKTPLRFFKEARINPQNKEITFIENDAEPYQVPYEDVLPNNPTYEEMRDVVCTKRQFFMCG